MLGLSYTGGRGATIDTVTTSIPILHGDKAKHDSTHCIGAANATENSAGFVIKTTGFYEKNVGNRSSYDF
jgi:hypothetical protein